MKRLTDCLKPGKIHFRTKIFEPDDVMAGIRDVERYLDDNIVSSSPFVYLFAENHLKSVVAFFGIIASRRICVVIDPDIGPLELMEMLRDTPPSACIRIDEKTLKWDFGREVEICPQSDVDRREADPDEICMMMYTAADDGYAKAAMLTHDNICCDAQSSIIWSDLTQGSIIYSLLPFCHLYGLQTGVVMPNLCGVDCVIEDNIGILTPSSLSDCIERHKATHMMAVPLLYYMLGKYGETGRKLRTIRCPISGGYKLSEIIANRFKRACDITVFEGYGLTEASPSCTYNSFFTGYKPNSIGKAIDCCTVSVVNEKGGELPCKKEGEIVVRGDNVMKGYYRKPDSTLNALRGGWLHTGDIGWMDEEGYCFFVKTRKCMINYGGNKIYPRETERLVKCNPSVEYMKIEPIENGMFGQTQQAFVRLVNNTGQSREMLQAWMKRNLTWYKVPKKISFI